MTLLRARLAQAVALLSIGLLGAGCAATLDGRARPAPKLTPRPLTGHTIEQVLLPGRALSRILNQSFNIDARFPPQFGGPEALQADGSVSAVDCLGVAMMLQQSVYQSTNVKDVAVESWRRAAESVKVTSVKEGVVSLPTAADANALFAKFSQQWQKCDGATQPMPASVFRFNATTTNVQVANSVLAATVSFAFSSPSSDSAAIPAGRAIGVRDNCLVEVEVNFFNTSNPSHQESDDMNTSALDIAHAMMDKVSDLSLSSP